MQRKRAEKKAKAIAKGTYRAPGSAPGEKRGGGPKRWRTPEYIREQNRIKSQRYRARKKETLALRTPNLDVVKVP